MKTSAGASSAPDDRHNETVDILNAALESMPYGFSIWDDSFHLVLVNQRYFEIYNLPREQFRPGMSLETVIELTVAAGNHPGMAAADLYPAYRDRLARTSDPTLPLVYEKSIGGRTIKTTHMRRPGIGWVVIHEDITESRRRESATREQHRQLDAALDSMPYGFCLWDKSFHLILSNRRFLELYGLDPAVEWRGASLFDVFLASAEAGNHQGRSATELLTHYRGRLSAIGEDETFLAEEVLVSGRIVKVSFRRTTDGCWLATHDDITEQKDQIQALRQREWELARQNMRFEAAVDNMSQGLCMFDSKQRLIICNKPYADLYDMPEELVRPGTTLEAILRNRVERGVHPERGAEDYIRARLELVTNKVEAADVVEMQDGRVISVLHHPMADGGWVSTHQDITKQRQTEARIRHLARHDALTDLPNRMLFRERMEEAEALVARNESVAVLFIDLDHYKTVNDLFGHAVGDAVLVKVASRLSEACRNGDIAARLGGDEFAILQSRLTSPRDAATLADRLVKAMAEPMTVGGHEVVIGASVGIAIGPGDGRTTETLMKNADLALYRAKAEGRGTFHFFEADMDAALQKRLAFEMELRTALAYGEFTLAFQPLFNLAENRICGFEALLRWQHPKRGVVMPDEIIPVAEDSGLIVPIGEWVLRAACLAAAEWPEDIKIAVNLSPVQFRHRNLVKQVETALAESGLAPGRLELEVTESALLAGNDTTLTTLHRLRCLGVGVALDDFGTGYSSLSYLRAFPFDKIKIDRSFVEDVSSQPDSVSIIRAVIGLGRSLGMSTTAEGVETADQLDLVREQGCTEVQGFLFSPPLPAGSVATFFAETANRDDKARQKAAS